MNRNQQVLATAFRKARGKRRAIKRLEISADWSEDQIETLAHDLAEAKAIETSTSIDEHLDGQQWYVESLVAFAKLSPKEQLDFEYDQEFPNIASEDELLEALEAA